MDSKIPIIRRNLNIAASSADLASVISCGQAEELAGLYKGKILTESHVSKAFKAAFSSPLLSVEYLAFCKYLTAYSAVETISFDDIYREGSTVSFLKNNYSSEAFEKFYPYTASKAVFETDFNSVCESAYSGNTNYAIVPLFNTNDGLMVSLYRMIARYELKAVLGADVMMGDGATETKFMLLSRRSLVQKDFSRILVTFTHDTNNTLPGLLTVCANEGIKFRFINTLPLEYTDDRREIVLDMDVDRCNRDAFVLFLKTALPDINIIGMYTIVN